MGPVDNQQSMTMIISICNIVQHLCCRTGGKLPLVPSSPRIPSADWLVDPSFGQIEGTGLSRAMRRQETPVCTTSQTFLQCLYSMTVLCCRPCPIGGEELIPPVFGTRPERDEEIDRGPDGPGGTGPGLDILGRQAGLLAVQQQAAEVLYGGQPHLVPVLAVNVQEDAEEH